MARFTKYITFALTPELLEKARTAAQQQGDSLGDLIRTALERHLTKMMSPSLLDIPLVEWTPEEKEYADKVLQEHFDEDRNDTSRYA